VLAFQDPLNQLPPAASTFAADIDFVYYVTLGICAFFFVLITGILGFSVLKWRRRTPDQPPASQVTHNTVLEVIWTVIPLIIVMVLFAWGWKGALDMTVAPADALPYEVTGRQWSWSIKHPGETDMESINEMWVPVGKPVKLTMHSADVLHAFFVPAFRTKRDVIPGRKQMIWFQATTLGSYPIFCAEYCGKDHSYMLGTVHVVDGETFASKPWRKRPEDPVEWGQMIWSLQCKSCHTVDGTALIGPSWKGLWGSTRELAKGGTTAVVDEAYVKESLLEPDAKKAKGFEGVVMTPITNLGDDGIAAVIEYMKTLK
jgi:cytochrome c oxidase subunit 2